MSGSAILSRFANVLGEQASLVAPDALEIGGRISANNEDAARGRKARVPKLKPIVKQEVPVTERVPTAAEVQATLDGELEALVKAAGTPEAQASMLIKIGIYRQDLARQAPLLKNVDPELADEVINAWFAEGDAVLKRAVWNAAAGSVEIPMAKAAPENLGEQALGKMVDEAATPQAKAHLLQKIGAYTHDVTLLFERAKDQPQERRDELIKGWLDIDSGETALKKNILDCEMGRSGKAIYGTGVQAGQVVTQMGGNAATHTAAELGGSDRGSSTSIARTIPRAPKGEGAGPGLGTQKFAGQADAGAVNPGSGPNDTGGGEVTPAVLIRRKGTTGGLGSVAGAETAGRAMTTTEDKVDGKTARGAGREIKPEELGRRKRDSDTDKKRWKAMDKRERGAELVKIAPDAFVNAILTIEDADEQTFVCEAAGEHAADLAEWVGLSDPMKMQKSELDSAIAAWLSEDPDTLVMKKFVAEALGTAEEIPLDLAKAIMAWEPPKAAPTIRVRQPVAA